MGSPAVGKHPLTSCFVILDSMTQPHMYCLLCQYGVNDWSWFLDIQNPDWVWAVSCYIPVYRGKGQNMLYVMLSQEIHNKMPMLPSEETLLMTAGIL